MTLSLAEKILDKICIYGGRSDDMLGDSWISLLSQVMSYKGKEKEEERGPKG